MQFRAAQGSSGASERVDGAVRECAREVFAELLKAQLAEYAAGAEDEAEADAAAVRHPCPQRKPSFCRSCLQLHAAEPARLHAAEPARAPACTGVCMYVLPAASTAARVFTYV